MNDVVNNFSKPLRVVALGCELAAQTVHLDCLEAPALRWRVVRWNKVDANIRLEPGLMGAFLLIQDAVSVHCDDREPVCGTSAEWRSELQVPFVAGEEILRGAGMNPYGRNRALLWFWEAVNNIVYHGLRNHRARTLYKMCVSFGCSSTLKYCCCIYKHGRVEFTNGGPHPREPIDRQPDVHPWQRKPRRAGRGDVHGDEHGAIPGGLGEHLRALGSGR